MQINIKSILNWLYKLPNWLLIVIAGALVFAAFPPSPLGFLSYFGLIPLIIAFIKDDFRFGFEKGYLFGLMLNLGILYWLAFNKGAEWYYGFLSMISGVLFLALAYGVTGMLFGFIGNRLGKIKAILLLPFIWTAMELLRSFGVMGFTWNNLCYTQCYVPQLIQFASVTGSFGVSFWIVTVNITIYFLISNFSKGKRKIYLYSILTALFLIPEIFGIVAMKNRDDAPELVKVGLIQPNVDANAKWNREEFSKNMQQLHDLTDSAAVDFALDLVVWPETATPTYLRKNRHSSLDKIQNHLSKSKTFLLTGAPDYSWTKKEGYKFYNSTFFISPSSKNIESYSKIKLVPLGEYIPLSEIFPKLKQLNLGQGNFSAGEEVKVFKMPLANNSDTTLHFTTAVCYESTFPDLIREGAGKGSEMLLIVSNDAWFGYTSAPFLHAEISRLRAIENRIPVIRAANTGVSLIFDAFGRKIKQTDFNTEDWLSAKVQQGKPDTFYVKFGNWLSWLCVIVSSGVFIIAIFRRDEI